VVADSRLVRPKLTFERDYMLFRNAWARGRRWSGDHDEAVRKLSLRAIGLLAQLMSHDEGFTVTFRQLARDNSEGDHAIRSAVAELRAAGFLKIEKERYRGKIVGSVWVLCDPAESRGNQLPLDPDAPHAAKPRPRKPHVDSPHVAQPHGIEVTAREDLPTSERTSSSTRARNSEDDLDHLWQVCPRSQSSHAFPLDGGWCACGQARADGALRDRHGALLREAVLA
jgi:hypothetical protein